MSADLVIVVPMLGRPHRVVPLLESIDATVPKARVLFAVSPGDHAVHEAIDKAGRDRITVPKHPAGDFQRKINTGIQATTEPHIFTGADDLRFHPGWYEAAAAKLTGGAEVIGTDDRCNRRVMRGEHATHMLVTRDYVMRAGTIDERGKFFHDGYPHEFCDDEAVATAKHRGAWAFAHGSVVEHLHPMIKKAPMDALYAAQPARMRIGAAIYRKRQPLWA